MFCKLSVFSADLDTLGLNSFSNLNKTRAVMSDIYRKCINKFSDYLTELSAPADADFGMFADSALFSLVVGVGTVVVAFFPYSRLMRMSPCSKRVGIFWVNKEGNSSSTSGTSTLKGTQNDGLQHAVCCQTLHELSP